MWAFLYSIVIKWCLLSVYHDSPLGCGNVDWFVAEVVKLENKMNFISKTQKKVLLRLKKANTKIKLLIFVDFVKKVFFWYH